MGLYTLHAFILMRRKWTSMNRSIREGMQGETTSQTVTLLLGLQVSCFIILTKMCFFLLIIFLIKALSKVTH